VTFTDPLQPQFADCFADNLKFNFHRFSHNFKSISILTT
jgi:hypothetical protein